MVGVGLAVGLIGAAAAGGLAHRWGLRSGFVDVPDDQLKTHSGSPVPLGGAALMIGVHGGMAAAGVFDVALFLATVMVFLVGIVDDWRGLSPVVRLVGMTGAGAVFASLSDQVIGGLPILTTVLLVMLAVNAVNLLDGLDALAGSVTTIAFLGLAVFAAVQNVANPWMILIVSAALLGFLVWNLPPARLYLGDNGAYVIGLLLVWAVVEAGSDWPSSWVGAALIGVPFLDMAVTVARRLKRGLPLFAGDRDHTYDRLRSRGFSLGAVALVFSGAQAVWMALLIGLVFAIGDRVAILTAIAIGLALVIFEVARAEPAPAKE